MQLKHLLIPDHLTRFDKMIEESNGESMVQVGIQGILYLYFVNESVRKYGPEAPTSITFSDVRFSIGISLLLLAVGKFKVTGAPHLCLRKVQAHLPNKKLC